MATVPTTSSVPAQPAGTAGRIAGKYLSLTTFRRDGSGVATPLWFVDDGDCWVAVTGSRSAKMKRIRRNPDVTVARCNARGTARGPVIAARVELLPEAEHARVDGLMAAKYRVDRLLTLPVYRLVMRLRGRRDVVDGPGAYLAIRPT